VRSEASPLQRELKQRRPFRSRKHEGAAGLLRTADLLRRHLARVVEPHGITLQQYNVLRILRGAGEEGLPTLEIATRMIEESPGITRLLDRLETKRLVRRERCPRDRRRVLCYVTSPGLSLVGKLDKPVDDADEAFLGGLAGTDLERFVRTLDALRAARP
jgi:DNA-binding MarR family transcriptional regulator